jgi:hypothetical protein
VGDEDDLDALPEQIAARPDDPPASSPAVTDSGPTGVAESAFSEESATPVEPSDAMTGAASAFVRSAVRAEPSPDDPTDPWANLARARTSAFVGAPALALPLPSTAATSRLAAQEAEPHGRRRGVWAAIASGVAAAAAVVVYIAMDHRAPGAHSHAAMSAEQGGHAIEQTATTAVPQTTAPRPAAPPSELTASSVATGGQHAVARADTIRLGTASNTETASGGAAARAGGGGAATASAGSGSERSIIGIGAAAGWRSDAEMGGEIGGGPSTKVPPKSTRAARGAPATSEVGDAGGGTGTGTGAGGAQGAGDRVRLSDEDIEHGMQPVSGKVRACFAGEHGAATVRFAVAASGRVVTAVVTGALAGTPGAGCATSAVRTAAFAPWSGAPQIVEYRLPLD